MNAAIEVNHLTCRYDALVTVDRISFSVTEGEFFIIIGPNGSGKSTLMNTIAGLMRSAGGEIRIKNRPLKSYTQKDLARTIALVRQQASVDFPFTVAEVVMMGRAPHQGMLGLERTADQAAVREALTFTDLHHLANRKMHQLSGGERQRVFIARAICQDPEIMLLDEPTAALDLAHQTRIMDLMEKLKQEKGTTIVMISHDINLASLYADTLLLLKNGQVIRSGSPVAVLAYDVLESAYGCSLLVDTNPVKACPRITLVPESQLERIRKAGKG
ncbi:heme ABC transporter ATP-binding protein [bacterium]|nr:heme ABC transporter ATP-binding protein [bacterium]